MSQDIFELRSSAPLWQDKKALPRLIAASPQASTAAKTALNAEANTISPHKQHHSTKRQKLFAGSWVNRETDAYIEHRLQEGRKTDPKLSRSAVIRMMLEERALDETIIQQHAILAPLIRETMHAEFQTFTNRFLGPIARIAYEVGRIMPFLIGCFTNFVKPDTLHDIEDESDTTARVNATERTPAVDDVATRIKKAWETRN